jgi:CheY-like chemotaxis protein
MGMTQAVVSSDEESRDEKLRICSILVVDDDKACAQIMMWTLEILGYTAKMALDGPTAIELAKSFCPDVVLCDIGMPEMNGYEVCKAMRREPVLQNTIFIAHTGWGEKEHYVRSKEAGFDHHLVKPVGTEALKDFLLGLDKKTLIASEDANNSHSQT